jgi:hypothetical protein
MKQINNRWVVLLILTVGTVIGVFRGTEARQKWVFKIKNRYEEKRQLAEQKKVLRNGGVPLDDIEMAAFHKS